MNKNIYLRFDFPSENGPLIFTQPDKIITTKDPSEVATCLNEIDQAAHEGNYIAGYMSFELSYALFFPHLLKESNRPLLWFGVFKQKSTEKIKDQDTFSINKWKVLTTKEQYETDVTQILADIRSKKYTQINYTTMWEATFEGNPYPYYEQLKKAQQANYAAYLQLEDEIIASVSPELFFEQTEGNIKVRPMKGTIHRGKTYEEDQALKDWLQNSEKNRQENKLTTDLMCQELEIIADDIKITKAYEVEQYPTVYQMTSEITAKLKDKISFSQIIKELFPCTSIAGTPKAVTLEKIHLLEQFARHIYCGAIGYITPDKKALFNVAIRTLHFSPSEGKARYGAGGAITEGSNMIEEYKEVLTKTGILNKVTEDFDLIETIAIKDGAVLYKDEHVKRMKESAHYFAYPFNEDKLRQIIDRAASKHPKGYFRLRITLNEAGIFQKELTKEVTIDEVTCSFAQKPIHRNNIYVYHKTTVRHMYNDLKDDAVFDVLLYNERNEVTEFTIGNLVIETDRAFYTPPVTSGLLAGTFREYLLNKGLIQEKVLYKEDVLQADCIWLINSVREWVKVKLI